MRRPEYEVWRMMRRRCSDPKRPDYARYGGRGISVCERWASFDAFMADMGPRPTNAHQLERVNNDGPYSPANCCWVTRSEQARNTRANRFIEVQGERLCVEEWAARLGVDQSAIFHRLRRGWPEADAVTRPKGSRR